MSQYLKQSTSATLVLGPFLDSTDAVTAETGLTISQADVRLSKNAAAFAQKNDATSCTHMENGYYSCPVNTTDTGTLGRLNVAVAESGALPVWQTFMVLPANVFDSIVSGSDTLDVQVTGMGASVLTATAIASDAITAAKVASDVTTEIQSGLATASALTSLDGKIGTPSNLGGGATIAFNLSDIEAQTDDIGAAGAGLTALASAANLATVDSNVDAILVDTGTTVPAQISALNNISTAQVNAEVDTALADIHLDHLLANTYDPASKPGASDSWVNELTGNDGGVSQFTANALELAPSGTGASAASIVEAMFTVDTGETEATAVAGSAVYEIVQNAGGGSGLDAAGVRAAVGLASANLDTQLSAIDTVVDSILVDTNELQTDWVNGGRLDIILDARASQSSVDTIDGIVDDILADTDDIGVAGAGLTALASASALTTVSGKVDTVDTVVDAIKVDTAAILADTGTDGVVVAAGSKTGYTLSNTGIDDILARPMPEAYSTVGGDLTVGMALYEVVQHLQAHGIVGTTWTIYERDGTTPAFTLTLDDATTPTAAERTT